MNLKKLINKFYKKGNVCVTGLRGTGKDLLTGNIIARRNMPYISNLEYTNSKHKYLYTPLNIDLLDVNNKYSNFISGKINKYDYPYAKQVDIYISDAGVYLPSQYCNQLNKEYEGLITFQALSRQVGECNVHINVQNLNRLWDKVREQSEIYIRCEWCKVIFGFVIQKITIYEKYQSCLDRVKPCRVRIPIMGDKVARMQAKTYVDNFRNQHGKISQHLLIYKNKSKHDTLFFGDLLKNGGKKNEKHKNS